MEDFFSIGTYFSLEVLSKLADVLQNLFQKSNNNKSIQQFEALDTWIGFS